LHDQQTLAEKVTCSGKGLHSGANVALTLRPGRANTGVVFVRTDLDGAEIPAVPSSVRSIYRATTLGRGDATVATVEHLLAALYALEVDNVRVELDGAEVPVLDGSASGFVDLIRSAGLFRQHELRPRLRILERVEVIDGERRISVEPAEHFHIHYAIDFPHPAIRRQEIEVESVTAASFEREFASARTFGFLDEVAALREAGLGLGGDLDNTVVLHGDRVINPTGLRFPDEFVRHKALDLIGDLALLGVALEGRVEVERGGHALHQRLVSAILTHPGASEWLGATPEALHFAPRVAAAAR
jgi:UDP-3-O-[3-hydroxymyristoyl] N-acetylglucosamine deacetylase